jgi:glycolate oxidase FAD binding subunit
MSVNHNNTFDNSHTLQESIKEAYAKQSPLNIIGQGTKSFYGQPREGERFQVAEHCGVIDYEPSELVITARAGTPLSVIENTLEQSGQMLAFEPPHFGQGATLGGTLACGFSGPRRPYSGAARDFVLGIQCINGKGEILKFGGQVMKNVAGYDVSRLMVGALGSLGVLLEASLKVLPKPVYEITLVWEKTAEEAIKLMNTWAGQPLPLSAACHIGEQLYLRLSGTEAGVKAAKNQLGGESLEQDKRFWQNVREHQHPYFQESRPLWRLSQAPATPGLDLAGEWFLDWGGAQRWLKTEAPVKQIREAVNTVGGHATLFRHPDQTQAIFHPLPQPLAALHQRIKKAFDPMMIFNRS